MATPLISLRPLGRFSVMVALCLAAFTSEAAASPVAAPSGQRRAEQPQQAKQAEAAEGQQGDRAKVAHDRPSHIPKIERVTPVGHVSGEQLHTSAEAEKEAREARSLAAEERMADYGLYSVLIAFVALGVTSAGTIIIFDQVRMSRKAIEHSAAATDAMTRANALAVLDARPWIRVHALHVRNPTMSDGKMTFSAKAVLINDGKSIARVIGHEAILFLVFPAGTPHRWAEEQVLAALDREEAGDDEPKAYRIPGVEWFTEWTHVGELEAMAVSETPARPAPKTPPDHEGKYFALVGVSVRYQHMGGIGHTRAVAHIVTEPMFMDARSGGRVYPSTINFRPARALMV